MDIYRDTYAYLATLPVVQAWPELDNLIQRTCENQPPHWRMAARACLATGGTVAQSIPAVAALGAHFLSIVLIDDLLDQDPKGQHHTLGVGPVANMASALQALGHEAIRHAALPAATQARIYQQLDWMVAQTALGQYLDAQNLRDEAAYWRVTRTKSSPFFATAFLVGALMNEGGEHVAAKLGEIGAIYGEMVQISDDMGDVLATPADADWLQGRFPLPILFASLVPHPGRARFLELRPQVHHTWALHEAQEILMQCGAISYGIDQLLQRAHQISEVRAQTPLPQPAQIDAVIEGVLEPVRTLLEQAGLDEAEGVAQLPIS